MVKDYTFEIKRVPIKEDMPIYIDNRGGLVTDVFTPKSYIDYLLDMKMKALDDRMVNYIIRYLRERKKLQDQRHDTPSKYRGMSRFDIIHQLTHEEHKDYQRLYTEHLEKLRSKREGITN